MESGIYVTFLNADEPANRELPPVGPLDHVVLRQHLLLAERRTITQAEELGVAIDRWLEAELELQRAMGQEPTPSKRTERRFVARDGVYLRFLAFGDVYEREPVPEVGPFAVVLVGPRGVEADGTMLATRVASDLASWELTAASGDEFAGTHKSDLAFRTTNSAYHQSVARVTPKPILTASAPASFSSHADPTPAAQIAEPDARPTPTERRREPPEVYSPPPREVYSPPARESFAPQPAATSEAELTAADRALIEKIERDRQDESLRARIQVEERRRLGVDDAQGENTTTFAMRYRAQPGADAVIPANDGGGLEWGAALWRTRFLIIGVLAVLVGGYYFFAVRTGGNPSVGGQVTYVNIAQKFSSSRWDYVVNGVQRVPSAGTATARGEYYLVRVAVTNRGTDSLQTSPADFTLYDVNGTDYRAEGLTAGPYQTSENPGSQYPWPSVFPISRTVTFTVIFDVPPGLPRGMLLGISDLPATRVKLD